MSEKKLTCDWCGKKGKEGNFISFFEEGIGEVTLCPSCDSDPEPETKIEEAVRIINLAHRNLVENHIQVVLDDLDEDVSADYISVCDRLIVQGTSLEELAAMDYHDIHVMLVNYLRDVEDLLKDHRLVAYVGNDYYSGVGDTRGPDGLYGFESWLFVEE